uniref:Uncharacterized protein n=1 Tax=Romanomermis culicivorax TaxID=13658 RepID=A0A915JQN1_ROMCU
MFSFPHNGIGGVFEQPGNNNFQIFGQGTEKQKTTKHLYSKGELEFQAVGTPLIACNKLTSARSVIGYLSEKDDYRQTEKFVTIWSKISWMEDVISRQLKMDPVI